MESSLKSGVDRLRIHPGSARTEVGVGESVLDVGAANPKRRAVTIPMEFSPKRQAVPESYSCACDSQLNEAAACNCNSDHKAEQQDSLSDRNEAIASSFNPITSGCDDCNEDLLDYSMTNDFHQASQIFDGVITAETVGANPSGALLYHQPIVDRTNGELVRPQSRGSIDIASDCGDVKRQIIVDENLTNSILKDLICPICLEYFYFPVTVACGHTYCRYCIGHAKLAGKLCPLCRQSVGKTLNINTILSNLVKSLNLRKRTVPVPRAPEMSHSAEKLWWDEHCLKPFVSMPLFLRIMFGDVIQTPVFFDDLCTCLLDYFTSYNKWSKCKWVFTIDDCREVRQLIGFDQGDIEGTSTRLHNFVEDYLMANPHLSFRVDPSYPILLKVYHDVNHKIDGTVFSALDIQHKLPWDVGRHAKSLLHLPHSSVSLSHLLFAQCPRGEIGLLDVGSTIGTMLKLQTLYALEQGDRIHVGDKHEADVDFGPPDEFSAFKWDPTSAQVLGPTEMQSLDQETLAQLEVIESNLRITVYADQCEPRSVNVPPKGLILGRGPHVSGDYAKLSITTQNGYISREHCLLFYDGSQPPKQRWILRDMSTLGTFLKLKPFQEPTPIKPGQLFKVGQCKVEVCDANDVGRRVPSPAAIILSQLLQSHLANTNPLVAMHPNTNSDNQD
ncbi:bifunctional SMAD-FHA domain superfamily/Zinc finger [Babesia duncani]|uniref:E3 ubiquitin-protein ligase CHFR n=1 Tax=Babesia duncani TaxID=323732 RepID=A0AAD9PKL8_9APIC|nr:bifunctional SMAD-FHA domain superfamily/Zinc finger [Babesia duncani]